MKRGLFGFMLIMALVTASLCACTRAEEENASESDDVTEGKSETEDLVLNADGTVNYLYYYSSVLSRVYSVITYPNDDYEYEEGQEWLSEVSHYANFSTNLENYGYCIKDLSGDGIPELILTDKAGMTVYNLYTLVDYKPYLVCNGYFKCWYAYLGGNTFGRFVQAGGMDQILGTYELSKDGRELIVKDYYFTCQGDSPKEMVSYHNTIGESDKEKSKLIDNDDFIMEWNRLEGEVTTLGDTIPYSEKTIEIAYLYDNPDKKISAEYVADDSEYAQSVILYDNNGMYDIELLGLEYVDYTDMGNMVLGTTYIQNLGDTTGDEAVSVKITFGETVPFYGVLYTDANGVRREFAIDISGKDGSVYLWEF